MSNPFVAEIRIFAFSFAPTGWALCAGQLMPISQNTALFSLLGTTYGGDGKSTFALPNLQGSAPMQQGQGPGLTDRVLGETGGEQNLTLITSEMPVHAHTVNADTNFGTTPDPNGNIYMRGNFDDGAGHTGGVQVYNTNTTPNTLLSPFAVGVAGSSFPHNNMMPSLGVNFCIALQGVFPARP
jgi:microcystin-dependent protein